MKHLLDVNLLIAGIVQTHSRHVQPRDWLAGKQIVLCPIVELGFLRISTNNKSGIGLTMERARDVLTSFASERKTDKIPDDSPALGSHPRTSRQVTVHYLEVLAGKHGFKFATLDGQLNHPSAEMNCLDVALGRPTMLPRPKQLVSHGTIATSKLKNHDDHPM
jgi:predicted nucleic acid-binding protein